MRRFLYAGTGVVAGSVVFLFSTPSAGKWRTGGLLMTLRISMAAAGLKALAGLACASAFCRLYSLRGRGETYERTEKGTGRSKGVKLIILGTNGFVRFDFLFWQGFLFPVG